MKRVVFSIVLTAAPALAFAPAAGSSDALTAWFMHATAYNTVSHATRMAKPEKLPGKPKAMYCHYIEGRPQFAGVWELLEYDRTHHIAFATATTDQCSVALFRAAAPPVSVPDADLSGYSTPLGVHVGSTYSNVRSTYGGGPQNSASHFATAYTATVIGETFGIPKKKVDLPQTVTIVVDDGRVSAISIYTDMAGEF